jgi:nucleotide-binding universal stress UspA family protein
MIKKILVPLDGSKVAQKAAKYAVDLAKQTGATLTLLSIIDRRFIIEQAVSASASPTHLKELVEDYLKQSADAATDAIVNLCKLKRIKYKTVIRKGHPVEEIVGEAIRSKNDLIIMGSHGKSAFKATILGSVTYGVLHKEMKTPVLIVRR